MDLFRRTTRALTGDRRAAPTCIPTDGSGLREAVQMCATGLAAIAARRTELRRPARVHVQAVATLATALFVLAGAATVQMGTRSGGSASVVVAAEHSELARVQIRIPEPPEQDVQPVTTPASPDGSPGGSSDARVRVAGSPERPESGPDRPPNLLPTGKGMWFHHLEQTGSTPEQLVEHALAAGLTHVYVRLGSSRMGFYAQEDLDRLLPAAHDAGLKVVGWDFPYLDDPVADAQRALAQIAYQTPDGHRIDAFSADIETPSEGVALTAERVEQYATELRSLVGPGYPLVATVPNACFNTSFPYAQLAEWFDAFAPMVYWITRDPARDVACNMEELGRFGLPVLPIGQAYDPAIDNPVLTGLVPTYDDLASFMAAAASSGAAGVSFWAWHTATPEMWQAVADSSDFTLVPMAAGHTDPGQVAVLQRVLDTYGYTTPLDGSYGRSTEEALANLQARMGMRPTGELDVRTVAVLTQRPSRR